MTYLVVKTERPLYKAILLCRLIFDEYDIRESTSKFVDHYSIIMGGIYLERLLRCYKHASCSLTVRNDYFGRRIRIFKLEVGS